MLRTLGEYGIKILTKLVNKIYDNGKIHRNMVIPVFMALLKKPVAIDCETHRTMSLMSM